MASVENAKDDPTVPMRLEYLSRLYERFSATMGSADRFVNFAGIIAAGMITVGILGGRPLIAIVAPYGLTIVFVYQLQLYTDAERCAAAIRYVEGLLNTQMGASLFLTERIAPVEYRNRWSVKGVQAAYGLVFAATVAVSLVLTERTYGVLWTIGNAVVLLACIGLLMVALLELRQASKVNIGP